MEGDENRPTSVTVTRAVLADLRLVKAEISKAENRTVPMPEVLQRLVDFYRSDEGRAVAELDRVNAVLRENGFEYPLGARGVHDMAMQRAGFLEELEERERKDSQ